jgi:xanthine dehydrogenase accessory factor
LLSDGINESALPFRNLKTLFSDYIAVVYDESKIRSSHAPAGLPVNSRTPEEIAVSNAAEIIQVKNKN